MDSGILLIDKPVGITSFDVIRRLRRELNIRKMGHAGTLDPLASGLMIVAIGSDTKKLAQFLKLPKSYIAQIRVGESRTTGDLEGHIVETKDVEALDEGEVQDVLGGMVATLSLPVPAYSAIKQRGTPLYKRARKGQEVERPVRDMTVTQAELRSVQHKDGRCTLEVLFDVASGVYIRSLAEEVGRRLGYPATLAGLRRTRIGDYNVEEARSI